MNRLKWLLVFFVFASCDDIIEVEDIEDERVEILAPSENAVLMEGSITFSWDELEGADSYNLQIAEPNFNSARQVVLDTTLTTTSFSQELMVGAYEWRIRAENFGYITNYTTTSFEVQ
ncbi:hypothetical protein [Nonlabens agnitus]|uniref:Fibronectin type-III domain-containing protein n=1 Tax=Nonlabens agnitus TaxID=870484 RepID=A0A2S9WRG6_9FLAO|nr:hypothetical protein [Nonlabens agnitus]PRP65876.1 hypothetical protein BST86_01615 [Nonlabens agnitus]